MHSPNVTLSSSRSFIGRSINVVNILKNFHFTLNECWSDEIRSKKLSYRFFVLVSMKCVKDIREQLIEGEEEKCDCELVSGDIQYISVLIVLKGLRSSGFVSLHDGYLQSPRL